MHKVIRYFLAIILVFGLILVRKFEEDLFYDPFLAYFKSDITNTKFPNYDLVKVALHIFFRFALNSFLTLAIIGMVFWDAKKVKFTALVLGGFFLLLLPLYLVGIETQFSWGENIGFYIRRFLIQPVLLLILIPAFIYQNFLTNQENK